MPLCGSQRGCQTPLLQVIRDELGVEVRSQWTPGGAWLGGYQKAQLAHLVGVLKGGAEGHAAMTAAGSYTCSM